MKTCDVCNRSMGLIKFRYKEGFICKECYESASRTCTETVRLLSLAELKERCRQEDSRPEFEDFEITGRIGNYVLIDDKQKKLCIVNNRLQVKDYRKPEIISLADIKYCRITCNAPLAWEDLQKAGKAENRYVSSLGLELNLNAGKKPQYVNFLSSPISIKSFACQKSLGFMQSVIDYLKINNVECRYI